MSILTYFGKRFASEEVKKLRDKVVDAMRRVGTSPFRMCGVTWYPNDPTPTWAPGWYKLNEKKLTELLRTVERLNEYHNLIGASYATVADVVHLGSDGALTPIEPYCVWVVSPDQNATVEILDTLTDEFKAYKQGWVTLSGREQRYRDFLSTSPFSGVLINLYTFCRLDDKTQSNYFARVSGLRDGLSFIGNKDQLGKAEYFLFPDALIRSSGITEVGKECISVFYLDVNGDCSSIRSRKLIDFSVVNEETIKDYLTTMEMVPRALWSEHSKRIVRALMI